MSDQSLPLWQPTRRQLLTRSACGFGSLALASLLAEQQLESAHAAQPQSKRSPLAPKTGHHKPLAKRVIFLFMHGGPSHVDTFDYKPRLEKEDGKPIPIKLPKLLSGGTKSKLMKSPWKFKQYGETGKWVSELFPETAKMVDDLCFLHGMHTDGQSHGQAVMKLHTGADNLIRPSIGSWISYGLGTQNQNLPALVTICPTRSHGGPQNYSNAFLPAVYQGTAIGSAATPASKAEIQFIANQRMSNAQQRKQLDFVQTLNREHHQRAQRDAQLEGVIESYELAFRMQQAAPKVMDLSGESRSTMNLYGINGGPTDNFGRQCLMARRFSEAGVRFVQVSHSFKWDQHGNLQRDHQRNAGEVDKPIAGLLNDLKERGLLKDTLVLWGGEFGRTPVVQGSNGRDHNPQGFTVWMAGAGVKPGYSYGETDEFGYFASKGKVHMHDLHATILHILGIDHEKLTYRYAGRDFRLTDVYGRVCKDILT